MYAKGIKFSNSVTVEHNTLGGGAIGHIVRNRRIAPDTAVLTDRWFHYDQVGSVLSESGPDGQLVTKHYQDAFGVRLADWETGVPGGVREGWAHNTKELDPGTGLMYMFQRHYVPEYGMFMSRAPLEADMEHEYGFAMNDPLRNTDPEGRHPAALICASEAAAKGPWGPGSGCRDFADKHCLGTNTTLFQCLRRHGALGQCRVRQYRGILHDSCHINCIWLSCTVEKPGAFPPIVRCSLGVISPPPILP